MNQEEIILGLKAGLGYFIIARRFAKVGLTPDPSIADTTERMLRETLEAIVGPIDDQDVLEDMAAWLEAQKEKDND